MRNGSTLIDHLNAADEAAGWNDLLGPGEAEAGRDRLAVARRMSRRRNAQVRALAERVHATCNRPEA